MNKIAPPKVVHNSLKQTVTERDLRQGLLIAAHSGGLVPMPGTIIDRAVPRDRDLRSAEAQAEALNKAEAKRARRAAK